MKKFAFLKNVDRLGRIVIPKQLREYYGIGINDRVELVPTDKGIMIAKETIAKSKGGDGCQNKKKGQG